MESFHLGISGPGFLFVIALPLLLPEMTLVRMGSSEVRE
jgi:hypothetical protein